MNLELLMPYFVVALFGLAFGSFLNVCIYRLPREESIITPRSHCPQCGKLIAWYDNLPVLSYLLLRGKCRQCKGRISPLYPTVEILTAALLVAAYARDGLSPAFIKNAALGMLLLILIFTDFRERRIPHAVTLLGMSLGVVLSFIVPVDARPVEWLLRRAGFFPEGALVSLLAALSGAAVGGGLLYLVGAAFYRLMGKEALGFGDVMLMLMIGTFLGVPLTLLTILLGSLLGTLIAAPLEMMGGTFRRHAWPYGSFLGAAGIYASLGGDVLLQAYLRWAGLAG